jgi:hypothetical protein
MFDLSSPSSSALALSTPCSIMHFEIASCDFPGNSEAQSESLVTTLLNISSHSKSGLLTVLLNVRYGRGYEVYVLVQILLYTPPLRVCIVHMVFVHHKLSWLDLVMSDNAMYYPISLTTSYTCLPCTNTSNLSFPWSPLTTTRNYALMIGGAAARHLE